MKSYKAYNDGQFLKKADVNPPVVWTITDAKEQTVTAPGKPPQDKVVLFFDGSRKGLVLNMACGDALYDITGHEDPEEWIGQQVELFVDDNVNYAGKRIGGVRLRKPQT